MDNLKYKDLWDVFLDARQKKLPSRYKTVEENGGLKANILDVDTAQAMSHAIDPFDLYLHPNSNVDQASSSVEMQGEMPKVKSQCGNPDCFYYDSDILSDYYYCCNPGCYCFKPDWYYYL